MSRIFSYTCLLTIGCGVMPPMFGCSGQPVEVTAAKEITPEEAKTMVLRFLSEPDTAHRFGQWVAESRKLVEEDRPSRLPSGEIVVGPWVIYPAERRVQLGIDRADLDASFSKDGDAYVITGAEITEIRPKR